MGWAKRARLGVRARLVGRLPHFVHRLVDLRRRTLLQLRGLIGGQGHGRILIRAAGRDQLPSRMVKRKKRRTGARRFVVVAMAADQFFVFSYG